MADCGSEVEEEIEALEAIYIHELEVVKNIGNEVSRIVLQLHPATGDEEDKKFVCMILQLDLPEKYPNMLPEVSIRNPRGIGDEEIQSLLEDMHKLAVERKGGPMLYELIELAKESLTVGNIPHCLCMICLEHFYEGEQFTRTECYHYFHKSCLARYIQHFLTYDEEGEIKKLTLFMNQEERKVQCPVCREEIEYEADTLSFSPIEEKVFFKPTEEMKLMQAKMAEMLEKQRAAGGLIDVDAEKNKFLLKDDDVVHLPARSAEEPKGKKKPAKGSRYNDKFSLRRNRDEISKLDREPENLRNKGQEFRAHEERYKRDFDRPSSGFVRGKGRGKILEDKMSGKNSLRNESDREEGSQDKHTSEIIESRDREMIEDNEPHSKHATMQKESTSKAELSNNESTGYDKAYTKTADKEVSKEQEKQLNRTRHDEKINDKDKLDNQKPDISKERSPRNSSRHEKSYEAVQDGTFAEPFRQETKLKATYDTYEDGVESNSVHESDKNYSYSSKDESVKNLEKHKSHEGFGKPPSDYKDTVNINDDKSNSKIGPGNETGALQGKSVKPDTGSTGVNDRKPHFRFENYDNRYRDDPHGRHGKSSLDKKNDRYERKHPSSGRQGERYKEREKYGESGHFSHHRDYGRKDINRSGYKNLQGKKEDDFGKGSWKSHNKQDKTDFNERVSERFEKQRTHGGFGKPHSYQRGGKVSGSYKTDCQMHESWEDSCQREDNGSAVRKSDKHVDQESHIIKSNKQQRISDIHERNDGVNNRVETSRKTVSRQDNQKSYGGFGKPYSEMENNGAHYKKDYNFKDCKSTENQKGEPKEEQEKRKPKGGFGKPNYDRKDKNEIIGPESRGNFRNSDRRGRPYSGYDRRNENYRYDNRRGFHSSNTYHGSSRNSDYKNWKENKRPESKKPQNFEHTCDIHQDKKRIAVNETDSSNKSEHLSFSKKENDTNCDTDSYRTDGTEKHTNKDCDTSVASKSEKLSHPPGFKIGPPPGFKAETNNSEKIKPPPGF